MSKMDGLRAMREARYEAAEKRGAAAATARTAPAAPATAPAKKKAPKAAPAATDDATLEGTAVAVDAAPAAVADSDDLCGHRAISGRTCTREKGHAAKSHRYA